MHLLRLFYFSWTDVVDIVDKMYVMHVYLVVSALQYRNRSVSKWIFHAGGWIWIN